MNLNTYFTNCVEAVKQNLLYENVQINVDFSIENHNFHLIFVGEALVKKLSSAFNHHEYINGSFNNLSIYIVDEVSSKVKLPTPPWLNDNFSNELEDIWVSDADEIKVLHYPKKNILIMLNLITHEAIYWVKSAEQIPYYESSAPFRPIFHWWMSNHGAQLLHAAAVGLPNKGILLVGKGGSGKSNTAISCLDSELLYAADDYCLLSFNPKPEVHSLFATGKLFFEDLYRHPYILNTQFKEIAIENQDEKALFFLYPLLKERLQKSFPIKAIFIPKVTHKNDVKISPISVSKAYLALAPSTIFQLRGCDRMTHENITKLLNQVPCFSMELSVDYKKNTKAITDFLKNLPIS